MSRYGNRLTHGQNRKGKTTKEYRAWCHMKNRCLNPRADQRRHYQDRGITVCARWRDSFETFFADLGPAPSPKHSLERLDNNGPYEPGNVKWATQLEQMANTRTNKLVTFRGKTQHIKAWARELGIYPPALYARLDKLGWSVERALTEPLRKLPHRHRATDAS